MREIKFRARKVETVWTKKYTEYTEQPGEFVYGSLVDLGGTDIYIVVPNDYEEERTYAAAYKEANYVKVYRETVGQYIGLKDKEIYEGDLYRTADGNDTGIIKYRGSGFYIDWLPPVTFGLRSDLYFFDDVEIIGNIHENPELLEATRG